MEPKMAGGSTSLQEEIDSEMSNITDILEGPVAKYLSKAKELRKTVEKRKNLTNERHAMEQEINMLKDDIADIESEMNELKDSTLRTFRPTPSKEDYDPLEEEEYFRSPAHQEWMEKLGEFKTKKKALEEKNNYLESRRSELGQLVTKLNGNGQSIILMKEEKKKLGGALLEDTVTVADLVNMNIVHLKSKRKSTDAGTGTPTKIAKKDESPVQQNGRAEK